MESRAQEVEMNIGEPEKVTRIPKPQAVPDTLPPMEQPATTPAPQPQEQPA